jgi:propanol-preferring alcohol dehydrogenase
MMRLGGSLSSVGIPPHKTLLQKPVTKIVIKGLHITGSLYGSLKEGMEAVEHVGKGIVKPISRSERLGNFLRDMNNLKRAISADVFFCR